MDRQSVHVLHGTISRLLLHAGEQAANTPACGWLVGTVSEDVLYVVGTLHSLTAFGSTESAISSDLG